MRSSHNPKKVCRDDITPGERSVYEEAVRNGVHFLKVVQETWTTFRAMLRLFAWVLKYKNLTFDCGIKSSESSFWDNETQLQPQFNPGTNTIHDDDSSNAFAFDVDAFLDLQNWNDATMLRAFA